MSSFAEPETGGSWGAPFDPALSAGLAEAVLQSSPLPVAVLDPEGNVLMANEVAERTFGWSTRELIGQPAPIVPADDHERVWDLLRRALDGERLVGEEVSLLNRFDHLLHLEVYVAPVKDADGRVTAVVISWLDVAERKQHLEQLAHLATHDELTGLPNRRILDDMLRRTVRQSGRGRSGALLVIDVDRLKLINDSAGHLVGDRVLEQVAEAMTEALRPGDLLARVGGDEFVALAFDLSMEHAGALAHRLARGVDDRRIVFGEDEYDVTVSVGVSVIDGTLDAQQVLARADQALYAAKQLGRNRVVRADDERLHEFAVGGGWTRRIKNALKNDGFRLALQPIVSLPDMNPCFHEALVRLQDHEHTWLPDSFLRTAESVGLMPGIDAWVIDASLQLMRNDPDLSLFINLSPAGFEDDALLDHIEVRLGEVDRSRVVFEITETGMLSNAPRTVRRLEKLRANGSRIALDDFGAGFSSFSRLRRLPFDFLKIDGSLTRNIHRDPIERAITRGIVELGHGLGLGVIAEQVETLQAAKALCELGVDYGQGYCWGDPAIVPLT